MPEPTQTAVGAVRIYPQLFKGGILCALVAVVLYLAGLQEIARIVGWLAVVFGGVGIVLAGVASSADG